MREKNVRKLNIWLRQRCRKLSNRQQSVIVYVLSGIYLLISVYMIAQLFTSKCVKQEKTPLIVEEELLMDSPMELEVKEITPFVEPNGLLTENEREEGNDNGYGEE